MNMLDSVTKEASSQLSIKKECIHCNKTLLKSQKDFCCHGCEIIYFLLKDNKLPDYMKANSQQPDWDFLDHESTATKSPNTSDNNNFKYIKFYVENIQCSSCLWALEKIPAWLEDVLATKFDMGNNILSAKLKPSGRFSKLASLINALGYKIHLITEKKEHLNLEKKRIKQLEKKLAVSLACFGNIMLLSFAIYAGVEGFLKNYFEWLSFLLFLPVFFYSSLDFYLTSWKGFLQRKPHIDSPIAIAIIIGGILSTYNLTQGSDYIYFDSLTALVSLLLFSRYILRRIQKKFITSTHLKSFLTSQSIKKLINNHFQTAPINSIKPNDIILLSLEQRIPVDGTVLSANACIDPSALTGESLPINLSKGDELLAGMKSLNNDLQMLAKTSVDQSKMGLLLDKLESEIFSKSPLTQLTDQSAHWFTVGLLSLSSIYFIFNWQTNPEETIKRVLALVVIACPCALALATPLVQSLALIKSAKKGFLIKSSTSLEKIAKIKNIIFDKTGTLTHGKLTFLNWQGKIPTKEELNILYALERKSTHPIARSIISYIKNDISNTNLELQNFIETSGKGVSGFYKNKRYEVKSSSITSSTTSSSLISEKNSTLIITVSFYCNNSLIFSIDLGDKLHSSSKLTVDYFRSLNITPYILSGDNQINVNNVATQLNIPIKNYFYQKSPNEKSLIVEKIPFSMMVGDGINDLAAMNSSLVSVSMHGGATESLNVSDIFLLNNGPSSLQELHTHAMKTQQLIHRNLYFSIAYNSLGAIAALTGHITPLIAAILMPISSLTVVLTSLQGFNEKKNLSENIPIQKLSQ